jgi:hypothetical protein
VHTSDNLRRPRDTEERRERGPSSDAALFAPTFYAPGSQTTAAKAGKSPLLPVWAGYCHFALAGADAGAAR